VTPTVNFTPVFDKTIKLAEFSQPFTVDDLRAVTNASIDLLLGVIRQANDEAITFVPHDPHANDPHAAEEEQHVGWSLAHLIVHVSASSEENATIASILARGIPYGREPRLRYETHWQTVTTQAQVVQRLEESRRIRLAYLAAFPDEPHLGMMREASERSLEVNGRLNAIGVYLAGLYHEWQHYDQIRDALRQALEAQSVAHAGD
jgi:hypothetical protein